MTHVWDTLTWWLPKGVLKQRFLESDLTQSFTLFNFGNTLAMTIIFSSKCLKIDVNSRNGTKTSENVSQILDNSIWNGRGRFSQFRRGYSPSTIIVSATPLKFQKSQRDTFRKTISFRVMKNYNKKALMKISQVFGTF